MVGENRAEHWAKHGLAGNRAAANRAADLAYNQTVNNGPESWWKAYKLRVIGDDLEPLAGADHPGGCIACIGLLEG
jgi:hypothetical protein